MRSSSSRLPSAGEGDGQVTLHGCLRPGPAICPKEPSPEAGILSPLARPVHATRTMPLYIFDKAYTEGDFGYASTIACALCVILLAFSAAYWQLHRLAHEE